MRLHGKVALITGSCSGIGLGVARAFAREGAAVVINHPTPGEAEAAASAVRSIQAEGGRAVAVQADVSLEAECEHLVARCIDAFSRVDILVNNAGIAAAAPVEAIPVAQWDRVIAVHLRGTFLMTRAAQRHMVEKRRGKIVNLSSTSALGNRGQANYSSAKAGLQAFTRTAAIELGPFNVNVNAVAPGFVDTEMTRQTAARRGFGVEEYKAMRAKSIPLGRVGVPRDIANVVAFLCSEEASFVSGQIIYVKGGPETLR